MRRFATLLASVVLVAGCGGQHKTPQSALGSVHPPGWGQPPKGLTLPRPLLGVPTGEMFDAVTLSQVPASPFAVAGYTAGNWPTWFSLAKDFPSAHRISVAISARYHAMCLDVEPGDASPDQAGAWAKADMAAGFKVPCVYSNLSQMPSVQASLAKAGLQRSQYLLWLAWYRFTPGLVAGYDAVQWTDKAQGRNLDESTVTLNFLRIAEPPYVPPPPPLPPLPKCFTHRIAKSQCDQARARVKAAQRGQQQSLNAYLGRGCDVLKAREHWFADRIAKDHSAFGKKRLTYRKGALAATKRAEARQQCGVFAGRVSYFGALQTSIERAN